MSREGDAFGAVLRGYLAGDDTRDLIERSDGFLDIIDPAPYLAPPRAWPEYERRVLRHAQGRVLDIGCGAGRHALRLQERGHDVVGIDSSPGAVAVARERGVRRVCKLDASQVSSRLGRFNTLVLLGNNLGLLASRSRGPRLLRRLRSVTAPGGVLLGSSFDPRAPGLPREHARYQRSNLERGRMRGQIRMRHRFRDLATPWYDYLFVSQRELGELVRGTGWRVAATYPGPGTRFSVVLERVEDPAPTRRPRASQPRPRRRTARGSRAAGTRARSSR